MAPLDDKDDDKITTAQFEALVVDSCPPTTPDPAPVSPRRSFMYSPEVRKLSETQRTARAKARSMVLLLKPSK